ncbi:MAG: hypothetical protein JXK07_10115 [Spirochaetes bacterium]|nr:hypothetical protein [Spirochaetota bacterium]MBN2771247.1 hypothetical protein [Spirochaetota bacterium]
MIQDKRFDYSPKTGILKIDKRLCKNDTELKKIFVALEKTSWVIATDKTLWYFKIDFNTCVYPRFRQLFPVGNKHTVDVILLTPNWIPLVVWQKITPRSIDWNECLLNVNNKNSLLDETYKFVLLKNSTLLGVFFVHEVSAYTLSNQLSDSESSLIIFRYTPVS